MNRRIIMAMQADSLGRELCQYQLRRLFSSIFTCYLFRGKGDYHRLGHGTDDHVRRPRRVTALQGKKVISIACGSLHCVAGTDTGMSKFP